MHDDSDALFLGNTAGHQAHLVATLGARAMFGDANGTTTPRVRQLQGVLSGGGFPIRISANVKWLDARSHRLRGAHGFALYRVRSATVVGHSTHVSPTQLRSAAAHSR
jgi:hypothetical protein